MADKFLEKVNGYIEKYNMIGEGDSVVVGVSGGADSTCLLMILANLREKMGIKCHVIHVNHLIRGEEAKRDEDFVVHLCSEYGIECTCVHIDVRALAKELKLTVEETGRKVRYAEFAKKVNQLKSEGENVKIAVAHNMNDNAETILFNMFRGTGLAGMCGIKPVVNNIIRPLLCAERKEIEEFLEKSNQKYCIDSTNLGYEYTRNVTRYKILGEACENINEKAVSHINDLSEFVCQTQDFVESIAKKIYDDNVKRYENSIKIEANVLREQHDVIATWIIRRMVEDICGRLKDISKIHIDACTKLLQGGTGKSINLPYNLIATLEYSTFAIYQNEQQETYEINISERLKSMQDGEVLEIKVEDHIFQFLIIHKIDMNCLKNDYTKWFDYDKIYSDIFLRQRKTGDSLIINKEGKQKKLKDYFIDKKVPGKERDKLLMLAQGNQVLWIPGYRSSEGYHVTSDTKNILQVNYVI